jgi:hypothetical protein
MRLSLLPLVAVTSVLGVYAPHHAAAAPVTAAISLVSPVPAGGLTEDVYYYRGRYYPYRYGGHYYSHRYYRGGRWRYY